MNEAVKNEEMPGNRYQGTAAESGVKYFYHGSRDDRRPGEITGPAIHLAPQMASLGSGIFRRFESEQRPTLNLQHEQQRIVHATSRLERI